MSPRLSERRETHPLRRVTGEMAPLDGHRREILSCGHVVVHPAKPARKRRCLQCPMGPVTLK